MGRGNGRKEGDRRALAAAAGFLELGSSLLSPADPGLTLNLSSQALNHPYDQ